jgi:hypothetical protein
MPTLGPVGLALALSLSPPAAGRYALLAVGVEPTVRDGRRDLGEQLERIAYRESIGKRGARETVAEAWARSAAVGVHVRDAASSRRVWRKMVRRGALDPACQPYEDGAWSTRGPWGLMAGLHARWLPRCFQPHWLDVPLVSALVAARKYLEQCEPQPRPRRGWCKRT